MIDRFIMLGFVIGFMIVSIRPAFLWIRRRIMDVQHGYREHWWSAWHAEPLTFQAIVEMYETTNTAMKAAFRDHPASSWLREYPKETR